MEIDCAMSEKKHAWQSYLEKNKNYKKTKIEVLLLLLKGWEAEQGEGGCATTLPCLISNNCCMALDCLTLNPEISVTVSTITIRVTSNPSTITDFFVASMLTPIIPTSNSFSAASCCCLLRFWNFVAMRASIFKLDTPNGTSTLSFAKIFPSGATEKLTKTVVCLSAISTKNE